MTAQEDINKLESRMCNLEKEVRLELRKHGEGIATLLERTKNKTNWVETVKSAVYIGGILGGGTMAIMSLVN